MIVDPDVLPGLLLLAAEFIVLAAVGYLVVRVVLRQADDLLALAQGLVVGLALWGITVNFVLFALPGLVGAAIGWGVVLAMAACLAWRAPRPLQPRPRTLAWFVVAVLALFWAALASRQLLGVQDWSIQLGLAASIQAGTFPPELPWHPGTPVRYHYAPSLLVGLLAPPFGPDRAFVSELLDAYGWTSLVLVLATAIRRRGSWTAAVFVAPLLLTYGAWTVIWVGNGLLEFPVPAGPPQAGIRASIAEIYWPPAVLHKVTTPWGAVLSDIWKPAFTLGYALAFVVLHRAARAERRSWPLALALAGMVGFIGLLATTLAPVVLVLWAGLEVMHLVKRRSEEPVRAHYAGQRRAWIRWASQPDVKREVIRSSAGLALAALALLVGGGVYTAVFDGTQASGMSLVTSLSSEHWRLLGTLGRQPGGIAVLGVGPVVVAGIAALLSRRDPLVLALAAGAGLLSLAWLGLHHDPTPSDLGRVAGHARNLALAALLLALSSWLAALRPRWRWAIGAFLIVLVAWPTLAAPVRNLGLALGNGVQLANSNTRHNKSRAPGETVDARRYRLPEMSERLAAYIRQHTPVDARVLAADPDTSFLFLLTGRPNASGLAGRIHLNYVVGPQYRDAVRFLEPRVFRRLGLEYVYATDAWHASLPDRAVRWLNDPGLFELLARDGDQALYRVRSAFLELDVAPNPASFEALRALPPSLTVYLAPQTPWYSRIRVAEALPAARLLGPIHASRLHLRSALWQTEPLGRHTPDLLVLPALTDPWVHHPWRPIWRSEDAAIYAPPSITGPITSTDRQSAPLNVRVTDAHVEGARITFTTTFAERAPQSWTSQDWVLVPLTDAPASLPVDFIPSERGPASSLWFDGLLSSGAAATTHTYRLDANASSLSVRSDSGEFTPLHSSGRDLSSGGWALLIRLRHEWQPEYWRDVALIPVLTVRVWDDGEITVRVHNNVPAI